MMMTTITMTTITFDGRFVATPAAAMLTGCPDPSGRLATTR